MLGKQKTQPPNDEAQTTQGSDGAEHGCVSLLGVERQEVDGAAERHNAGGQKVSGERGNGLWANLTDDEAWVR
ncbi:hypothetical protein HDU67_006414 [Dinochytrium kinnereticum]|nr:hypothetical protein HDU67_006414 [Dinochytrium kinnereticum]